MNELASIIDRIESGTLLPASMFRIAIDDMLKLRESPDFARPWQRLQARIEKTTRRQALPVQMRRELAMLREVAFIRVYDFTEHPDLAGNVSDDFGLIGGALLTSLDDAWLNGLWGEYREHRFPCRNIHPIKGRLCELLGDIPFIQQAAGDQRQP